MNIGYMCYLDEKPMAEYEVKLRFKYCVEKLGHNFFEISSDSCLKNTDIHADNLNLDFIFCQTTGINASVFPDVFSCFCNWGPYGFAVPEELFMYFANLSKHDIIIGGNESYKIEREILQHPDVFAKFVNIVPSIPEDFILQPIKHKMYRLFYVGINLEKIQRGKTRNYSLLKYLDKKDLVDIYGPSSLYGHDNLWGEFKSYKGEIPFDGKTILDKINRSGICLAFHSSVHNNNEAVSNRIFEATAAGAVVITDKNKYIEKYYGDSVYYIDYNKTEEEQCEDIKKYINEIKENPDMAYKKACAAQNIFKEKLTFDNQIKNMIAQLKNYKQELIYKSRDDIVDVICFVENNDELVSIKKEIDKQYYKNTNLIVISYNEIKPLEGKNFTFIDARNYEKNEGVLFNQSISYLKGNYFIIMNRFSAMHRNHINKLQESLINRKNLFAYTGTYIRYEEKDKVLYYTTLNSRRMERYEFLSLLRSDLNSPVDELFKIEEKFAPSCVMFKKEILNFIDTDELQINTTSIQLYLALCSIIKNNDSGHYVSTISSGYKLNKNQSIDDIFFEIRRFFIEYRRCENTVLKNLFISFFKYDIDSSCCILPSTVSAPSKEIRILNKMNKSSKYKKIVCLFCTKDKNEDVLMYLNKHRRIKNILFFLRYLF